MGRSTIGVGLALLAALLLAGCQKQTVGPKVSKYQEERAAVIAKLRKGGPAARASRGRAGGRKAGKPSGQSTFGENGGDFVYDPVGKRDPFRSFILEGVREVDPTAKGPLEQFDLSQLTVAGVIWEGKRRRALVNDPSGQGYIVREGDRIGKNEGRVIEIGDSRMLVREAYVDFHGDKTMKEIEMRIRQSQGG